MRLLTVTHFYEAHGGGIERVAGHLCRAFARRGIEARWAASDRDPAPEGAVAAVPLQCLDPMERLTGLPMPIPGPRSIRRLFREVRSSDAVIIHDALYVSSILAMLAARRAGVRAILIQHIAAIPFSSRLLRGAMWLANRLVTRSMLRAADEVVFISDTVRHDLLGSPPWRDYHLVFNGVDTEVFRPGVGSSTGLVPRILFVGRFVRKKGLSIVRALAQLRPDFSIRLIGTGPIAPAEWDLANIADLGMLSPKQLAEEYRTADILLLPSVGEGYPLVIQEALACGLRVVCGEPANRADPEAAQWLHGVEVALGDPDLSARRCAVAIDAALREPTRLMELAQFAANRYSWDRMAGILIGLASPPDGDRMAD